MKAKRSYQGKVVWITGASSGIGEALAYRFNDLGARLVLSSNDEARLLKVAAQCEKANGEVHSLYLDLSHVQRLEALARQVLDRFGRVDILINNAGISQRSLVKDTDLVVYQRIMDIDFMGQAALTKAVLPSMLARHSGHIVVTSSLAGKVGIPLRSGYCAAKHALHGFFDALRAEVWEDNIKVTLVCPATVKTDISFHALEGDGQAHGKMDDLLAKGVSVEYCAGKIMWAIEKEKEEILIGGGKKYAAVVKRFFPRLYSRIIRKAKVI